MRTCSRRGFSLQIYLLVLVIDRVREESILSMLNTREREREIGDMPMLRMRVLRTSTGGTRGMCACWETDSSCLLIDDQWVEWIIPEDRLSVGRLFGFFVIQIGETSFKTRRLVFMLTTGRRWTTVRLLVAAAIQSGGNIQGHAFEGELFQSMIDI